MKKSEFLARLANLPLCLSELEGQKPEAVNVLCRQKMPNVFTYAICCEKIFENNLAKIKPSEKRHWTWTHDLSIGEWCTGVEGVVDTCKKAVLHNIKDVPCMAEFLLSVNWKSWEHAARENWVWVEVYRALYYELLNLVYDYYEGDGDASTLIWRYLD